MTALGFRPSGRLGMRPRRCRPLATTLPPDQLTDLAFWCKAGTPQATGTGGSSDQHKLIARAVAKRGV
jgi:hypothetical protein